MEDESARLVESGSLRVDRARALDKLQRFQLGDPSFGFYFWVRCAVASGATRVSLAPFYTAYEIRFDGEPLSKAELRDPYAALFAEAPSRRAKHLAYAVLWASRLGGSTMTVCSGPPGKRLRLDASSLAAERLTESEDADSDTVVRASGLWARLLSRPWLPPRGRLEEMLGLCPAQVTVSGRPVPRTSDAAAAWVEEALPEPLGGGRVRLRVARERRSARSEAVVHLDGVSAGRFDYPLRFVRSEALVENPRVSLDASQGRAVRDAHLDAVLDAAGALERRLLKAVLDPGLKPSPEERAAAREAGWTLLNDPIKDRADPLLAALWETPLYEGRTGARICLREIVENNWFDDRLMGLAEWEVRGLKVFLTRIRSARNR